MECEFENNPDAQSTYVKSAHKFLARFHGKFRIHPAKYFLAAIRLHGRQVTNQLVTRSPFCILAPTNTDGQERGDDPDGEICRGH